jgi:hypothetical protein
MVWEKLTNEHSHEVPIMHLRCVHKINYYRDSNSKGKLEYFRFMIGNTAEALSCCSSRSDGDTLRVWFICIPFVPSEHGVKMTAPLEVCTKDMHRAVVRCLASEAMKRVEIHRQLAAKNGQNCSPQKSV